MRKTFIMTAMATVLAFQVAVADDVKLSNKEDMSAQKQHKLAKTQQEASKEANKATKKGTRIAMDAVMDFQFVMPENADRYKYTMGEKYVNTDTAVASQVIEDYDGGILGDYSKDYHYDVNALLNFKIEQALTTNMSVGGVLEVLTPVSSDRLRDYSVGAKSKGVYMFVKAPYFKAQAGAMAGAEQMLKIDPAMWSAADGGVTSGWVHYANLEGNFDGGTPINSTRNHVLRPFYITPALYSQYVSNDATFSRNDDVSVAPKVAVYSNEMNGFQVGASYAPHHVVGKVKSGDVTKLSPVYDNVIGFGARYEKAVQSCMVTISVAGEMGDAVKQGSETTPTYFDLSAISVGGAVKYNNMITVGGEYGHLGQSGLFKAVVKDDDLNIAKPNSVLADPDPDATYYWTVGGAYDMGPARISANYFKSRKNIYSTTEADESTMTDLNVGAHYNFSYGSKHSQLTPYAAYHHFTTEERKVASADNNKGNLFMLGVRAIF